MENIVYIGGWGGKGRRGRGGRVKKKQVHLFVPTLTQTNKFEITK